MGMKLVVRVVMLNATILVAAAAATTAKTWEHGKTGSSNWQANWEQAGSNWHADGNTGGNWQANGKSASTASLSSGKTSWPRPKEATPLKKYLLVEVNGVVDGDADDDGGSRLIPEQPRVEHEQHNDKGPGKGEK